MANKMVIDKGELRRSIFGTLFGTLLGVLLVTIRLSQSGIPP